MKKLALITNFAVLFFGKSLIYSQDLVLCKNNINEIKTSASASTWDNLRNKQGSLKFETGKILTSGLNNILVNSTISITSVPNKFLLDSSDNEYCSNKLTSSKSNPLNFSPDIFNSIDEANSWIGNFSQGKGKEGEDLYIKCDRSCSPQYTYQVKKLEAGKIEVKALVICGLPRDKDDNLYNIVGKCL